MTFQQPTTPLLTYQPGPLPVDAPGVDVLLDILTYKRVGGSQTEEDFIDKFLRPFDPYRDGYGNLIIEIGDNPEIMWSCHTDTVHHTSGRQEVYIDDEGMIRPRITKVKTYRTDSVTGKRYSKKGKSTNCLGADDGAGIWLLLEMMKAGIEGLYIFHREEESGGGGSNFIAKQTPNLLKDIKFAIAFDRKGYSDVITHQGWSRCASDDFAKSMADILGGSYRPDDGGLFTDTANYVDLIGECTNISMGYFNGHGPMECLDLRFIVGLRDTLLKADWSKLVYKREPGETDPNDWGMGGHGLYGGYSSLYKPGSNWQPTNWNPNKSYTASKDFNHMTSEEWDEYLLNKYGPEVLRSLREHPETDEPMQNLEKVKVGRTQGGYINDRDGIRPATDRDEARAHYGSLHEFCEAHPLVIASFLEEQGYNLWELEEYADNAVGLGYP